MERYFKNYNKEICFSTILVLFLFFIIFPKNFFCLFNFLELYSNTILALVAVLGLFFGQSWLNTSKKKMKGQLDFDIARKYLKAVLQVRDSIKIVRNPFVSSDEIQTALKKNGFNVDDYQDKEKIDSSVYSLRWKNIQKTWTSLDEVLLDAEVSWGGEAIDVQKGLDDLVRKLRSVIWLFINSKEDFNKRKEDRNILYGTHNESDEFAKNIDIEIEKIRGFLKKHL